MVELRTPLLEELQISFQFWNRSQRVEAGRYVDQMERLVTRNHSYQPHFARFTGVALVAVVMADLSDRRDRPEIQAHLHTEHLADQIHQPEPTDRTEALSME